MVVTFGMSATRTLGEEQMISHVWHSVHSFMTEQKYTNSHGILTMFHNEYNYDIFMAEYICE
jgi:hypothetical protein